HAIKALAVLSLAGAASLASAASLNQYIGVLSPTSTTGLKFNHEFLFASTPETFTDIFRFDLAGGNTTSGSTKDTDAISSLSLTSDVALESIALRLAGTTTNLYFDNTPVGFTFVGLQAGKTYELVVKGTNTPTDWSLTGSYSGTIKASTTTVAAAVPEASEVVLTAMGLLGVAAWARRQKRG
ncbi:MAG: hypothetical protein RI907_1826, partial [Pseudomonadota bacterium]